MKSFGVSQNFLFFSMKSIDNSFFLCYALNVPEICLQCESVFYGYNLNCERRMKMEIKQFQTGLETKKILLCLQSIMTEEFKKKFGTEDFEARIEYGYILNEAVASMDITTLDYEDLLNKKVVFPDNIEIDECKLQGDTVKFRLRDGVSEQIDKATLIISDVLGGVKVYRAMAVKLILKAFLCIKTNQ